MSIRTKRIGHALRSRAALQDEAEKRGPSGRVHGLQSLREGYRGMGGVVEESGRPRGQVCCVGPVALALRSRAWHSPRARGLCDPFPRNGPVNRGAVSEGVSQVLLTCKVKAVTIFVGPDRADAYPDLLPILVSARVPPVGEEVRWCVWHSNVREGYDFSMWGDRQGVSTCGEESRTSEGTQRPVRAARLRTQRHVPRRGDD